MINLFNSSLIRNIKLLVLTLFCMSGAEALAQVKGTVVDFDDKAIENVFITVRDSDQTTSTDRRGRFEIDANQGNVLIVSADGYIEEEIVVNTTDDKLSIVLFQDLFSLQDVVIGSRGRKRTDIDRPVPVDIIKGKELIKTGQTDLGQMIQYTTPSFNSAKYSMNGTTNYAEPSTLRGLSPDQLLVTVNGKRRHQLAALNLNVTPGLGTVVTDLNAIPAMALEQMEVLRDGAASQYGSDAIAGIINLSLKNSINEGTFQSTGGIHKEGDGVTFKNALNYGFGLGKEGSYFNFTLSTFSFSGIGRARPFSGNIYSSDQVIEDSIRSTKNVYSNDPVVNRYGSNENDTYQAFANMAFPFSDAVRVYAFGGVSRKDITASAFFRNPARTSRFVPEVFPDGYTPVLPGRTDDYSGVIGLDGSLPGNWNYDASYGYGRNRFDLWAKNTTNPSLGAATPTEFKVGRYISDQNVVELNLSRNFDYIGPFDALNLAFGGQWREDRFQVESGSPKSYEVGPLAAQGKDIGSSGRPGISEDDENDLSRNNLGAYVDLEADVSDQLLIGGSLRFENYSDFGSNLSGKFVSRYKLNNNLAIRGSVNRGFRAPSLAQIGNRVNTSTVQNNQIVITKQVSSDDPKLGQLGIKDPEAELSWNYNIGFTGKMLNNKLQFSLDVFQIDIDDRIVISERLATATYPAVAALFDRVKEIRFFTNHIDTRTRGLEIVGAYEEEIGDHRINVSLGYSHNKTEVMSQKETPNEILVGAAPEDQDIKLLGEVATQLIEVALPRNKTILNANYRYRDFSLNARSTRFGEVIARDRNVGDQTFGAKIVTDLAISYNLNENFNITLGSNNILDVYPDTWQNFDDGDEIQAASYSNGQVPYSRNSNQFGFSGAYYYLMATLKF